MKNAMYFPVVEASLMDLEFAGNSNNAKPRKLNVFTKARPNLTHSPNWVALKISQPDIGYEWEHLPTYLPGNYLKIRMRS